MQRTARLRHPNIAVDYWKTAHILETKPNEVLICPGEEWTCSSIRYTPKYTGTFVILGNSLQITYGISEPGLSYFCFCWPMQAWVIASKNMRNTRLKSTLQHGSHQQLVYEQVGRQCFVLIFMYTEVPYFLLVPTNQVPQLLSTSMWAGKPILPLPQRRHLLMASYFLYYAGLEGIVVLILQKRLHFTQTVDSKPVSTLEDMRLPRIRGVGCLQVDLLECRHHYLLMGTAGSYSNEKQVEQPRKTKHRVMLDIMIYFVSQQQGNKLLFAVAYLSRLGFNSYKVF